MKRQILALVAVVTLIPSAATAAWLGFESGPVRPVAMAPDGQHLFVANIPDNAVEIFRIGADGLQHQHSVPVGLEPVTVAARNNDELWVVNHLSDSISIVSLTAQPHVIRTLHIGDEPRDLVFAGTEGNQRAFITTAHRGQQRTHPSLDGIPGAGDPELSTAGIPRADVWVFDVNNLGDGPGGQPIKIVELFGDTPRALATSTDGSTVYAAVFHSGNQTAVVNEEIVCDGFDATTCDGDGISSPNGMPAGQLPGGNPGPAQSIHGDPAPEVGLIVRFDNGSGEWRDELDRNWSNGIRFHLPDFDVFAIDADSLTLQESYPHVGTVLFNMAVNPVDGTVYVSNTEAPNEVRFEGPGGGGSTVQGHLSESRISIIKNDTVSSRHLNKHIDYSQLPAPAGTAQHSLATPLEMVISADGSKLYVAAFGSSKIGVFDTAQLEDDSFNPATDSNDYLAVSGGGPSGLALDEARNRLYVLTRFNNAVALIDLTSGQEQTSYQLPNPEPEYFSAGRPFLYDAAGTSSNGEASCASCHIFGDMDSLSWDLGDPDGEVIQNPLQINLEGIVTLFNQASPNINGSGNLDDLHPMKGPMTTQTFRGMINSGAMHWRGDRSVGVFGTNATDALLSFLNFKVAFPGLLGKAQGISTEDIRSFADFALALVIPPNPVRALDNSLTPEQQLGQDLYFGPRRMDGSPVDFSGDANGDGFTCEGCHRLDPALGFFGTGQHASFENEEQTAKIPHLRNMYQKVGMFGMPAGEFFNPGDNDHKGDQVRGTGFLHDGSADTLFRFFNATVFNETTTPFGETGFTSQQQRRDMESFMFAFDNDLAPIVGQQITLDDNSTDDMEARVDLLLARGVTPFVSNILGGAVTEADIIVKGHIAGVQRGWYQLADGTFKSDIAAEAPWSENDLRSLAEVPGQTLTFTAVIPGHGLRAGIDRDSDGFFDGDDTCPSHSDPQQLDQDNDGLGDACDNCTAVANADQRDTNADGYGSLCDADLSNDGNVNLDDLALLRIAFFGSDPDADLTGDGTVNLDDLAIMRAQFFSVPGPSALH